MNQHRLQLLVCSGTGCSSGDSFQLRETLVAEIAKQGLEGEVDVVTTGCRGLCHLAPTITVEPEGILYKQLTKEDIPTIVTSHLKEGKPVMKLTADPETEKLPETKPPTPNLMDIGFFKHQRLIVSKNRGRLDPESIDEYIALDGYRALEKALTQMTPQGIVEEIKKSGLRGRGGAGFPTGLKWDFCRKAPGDVKYIVCNGDEGDPGAFMDRSVLEGDPHAVLEGMIIGARAMGAQKGYIYVRSEYPLAIERIRIALQKAEDYGLLGKNILGTGFDFEIEVFPGAGAFVCGEETALLASIEGNVGRPRPRPPYPAEKGLWGKPTTINNVETWANIAPIVLKGADWFASIGTETSKGTKVFSLVGKIKNTGLVEVPMGITLRDIIEDVGGGIPNKKKFKAVQTGGPSGGCIPESLLDLSIDYDNLAKAGSIMGSGGMIVMDEDTCMVDVARYFLNFTVQESCGKCTPCRVGTRHMVEILEKICNGDGEESDLDKLDFLAKTTKATALCGLGQTAPNPILTTMKYFRDEYEAHVIDKRCPALVCKNLIEYSVIPEKCTGCQRCVSVCPTGAITGPRSQAHNVDTSKCIKCRACYEICRFDAIAGDAIRIRTKEEE